jgi:hypothetical protein
MNPPRHKDYPDDSEVVDIKVPTSWLNSLLSARVLVPLGVAGIAAFGGFSARGVVEQCPKELMDKLTRMEGRLESTENRVEGLDRRFDRVDSRLERLSRRLDNLVDAVKTDAVTLSKR